MAENYLINGVSLDRFCWSIQTAEGLQDMPDIRGQDIVVPGAHGSLDLQADPALPRRRYGPGRISFRMWLMATDPVTGVVPADASTEFDAYLSNLDALTRLFSARSLMIEHPRTDGTRRAVGYLAEPLKPVRERTSPWYGTVTAEVAIPGAFWADTSPTTVTATVASGSSIDVSALACSAPITDAVLRFGPGNNPQLVQAGTFFAWSGVIAAARELLVDCGQWQLMAGAGPAWSPSMASIAYGPGPAWFELDPTAQPLQLSLLHTGGGSMNVSITARRKYLTS